MDSTRKGAGNDRARVWWRRPAQRLRGRLPAFLLVLMIALHLLLAAAFHCKRGWFPSPLPHMGYKNIVDQTRIIRGYKPLLPSDKLHLSVKTLFDGQRKGDFQLSHPRVLWRELSRGQLRGLWRNHDEGEYWNEIPLSFFLPALVHAVSGGSLVAVALSSQIFLALLLLFTYKIGGRAGGPWVGLAAAAIISGYPGIFELARTHHDSLANGVMATALVYLLLRGDGFTRLGICALGGVAAFLSSRVGENVSCTVLVTMIVAGPFLLEVVRLGRRLVGRAPQAWRGLLGLGLFLLPPLLLFDWTTMAALARYMDHRIMAVGASAMVGPHVPELLTSTVTYLAYPFQLAFDLLQPLMTLWLIAGAVLLWRAPRGGRLALVLMILVPLIPLSLIPKKAINYVIPFLPAMALITALGLGGLKSLMLRRWSLRLAAASGVGMLLFSSLAPPGLQQALDLDRLSPDIKKTVQVLGLHGYATFWHGDFNSQHKLAAASHQFVAQAGRASSSRSEPQRVAVFGTSVRQIEGFRYIVELSQPNLFVFDIIHPAHAPGHILEILTWLEDAPFDYLVYLDRERPLPWPSESWDAFRTRTDWRVPADPIIRKHGDAPFRRVVNKLRGRSWTRVDLKAGPIYRASRP